MSAAKPDTWMPLYWGDYLRDTMHLMADGHGAYLMLIGACWCSGNELPDDDANLAAIARLDRKAWLRLRPTLGRFFTIDGGTWSHDRVGQELDKAKRITEARSKAGKRGGRPKQAESKPKANANLSETPSPSKEARTPVSTVGDPDGSPAPVPAVINDRMPDIPLALQAHRARDPESMRLLIWNAGLAYLSEGTGKPPAKLRPWLGKLCKAHSDIAVMAALAQAQRDTPADPIAWIERNLNGSRSHDDDLREALADLREGAAG
jgi:uncharacterized protein YdaU (DUF1376 family)